MVNWCVCCWLNVVIECGDWVWCVNEGVGVCCVVWGVEMCVWGERWEVWVMCELYGLRDVCVGVMWEDCVCVVCWLFVCLDVIGCCWVMICCCLWWDWWWCICCGVWLYWWCMSARIGRCDKIARAGNMWWYGFMWCFCVILLCCV